MGRDIALHVHSLGTAIILGEGRNVLQGPVVEMVLEFSGQIGRFRGLVLRPPGAVVIVFPLALESLAVAAPAPEFRFLEIEGFHAGVDDAPDLRLLEILQVVPARYDVGDHAPVPDRVSVRADLSLIQVCLAVPGAGEVILIGAPGDAGHEIDPVAVLSPGPYPFLDGRAVLGDRRVAADPIDHHGIGTVVYRLFPGPSRLESRLRPLPVRGLPGGRAGCQDRRKGPGKQETGVHSCGFCSR